MKMMILAALTVLTFSAAAANAQSLSHGAPPTQQSSGQSN
jgi:hypothetical protein